MGYMLRGGHLTVQYNELVPGHILCNLATQIIKSFDSARE